MKRIVSICPSNTEILYFLGLDQQIVGLDNYSDWPSEWSHLPRLGPDLDIDIEKVKALEPDLVVASLSVPGMEKNIERLEQASLPYIILNPKSLHDIPQDILKLGRALGLDETATRVANRFQIELEQIQAHIPKRSNPEKLYWEWWPKPVFSPGKHNWLTDVTRLVGATHIFEEIEQESVQADWETVAQKQPDRCLIVWTGIPISRVRKELITSRPPFHGKKFATPERIHILEEGWYCRPSPRLLTGIKYLAHLLYPESFTIPDSNNPFQDNRIQ
ncbi:cobalamin-binding protein [Thermoflavimicrobium dichotomicum]|uniref:Iron complex transport system substrate-binding protein n=1 Tax=Thermoflavimicrobium dichotomicum TaxID=46223 RepID=A0A1I3LNH8_9BACL|nr:cobalamin-binding protein [Thermoflavimicrobium dichotomicum]SFI86318.1 iron complex transport system substrate-binding protein [Thermoflavimicrobium dichotomicum]